jgi:hypothetical protein
MREADKDNPEIGAWEEDTPLYRVPLDAQRWRGVQAFAGTNYPFVVRRDSTENRGIRLTHVARFVVESDHEISPMEGRRLYRDCFAMLRMETARNRSYDAALRLGGGDTADSIPQNQPRTTNGAVAFWAVVTGMERPVLAIRSPFPLKEIIKKSLSQAERLVAFRNIGTWTGKPLSLWYVAKWEAIPYFLGALFGRGILITWVQREGFPGAPPIKNVNGDPEG